MQEEEEPSLLFEILGGTASRDKEELMAKKENGQRPNHRHGGERRSKTSEALETTNLLHTMTEGSVPGAVAMRGPGATNVNDDDSSDFLFEPKSEVFGANQPNSKLVVAAEVVEEDTEDLKAQLTKQRQEMAQLRTQLKRAQTGSRRQEQERVAVSALMERDAICAIM